MSVTQPQSFRRRKKSILPIIGIVFFVLIIGGLFTVLTLAIREAKKSAPPTISAEDEEMTDVEIRRLMRE